MARISVPIPSLFNGVSQQDPTLRLPSQCEVMDNAYALIADGLRKRPPTNHVALLDEDDYTGCFFHEINRDEAERYLIVISDGDLQVWDLQTGTAKTVNFPDGKAYLDSDDPMAEFAAVTVADHTFIVNRGVEVEWGDVGSGASEIQPYEAYAYVKRAVVSTDYKVTVNGTTVTYTTGGATQPSTLDIAENLRTSLDAVSGFTATRIGSVVKVYKDDGSDFTFSVEDSYGEQALIGIKGFSQRFSDLPPRCYDTARLEVAGEDTSNFDNYYVEYSSDDGVWHESRGWGLNNVFDASTMPHKLVRESDGTFTFEQVVWADREVGDDESAPAPTFVGKTISDIYFFRNRLGFLTDENVVLSRAGEFYNFWPETVTQSLATDPIDVAVSHVKVSLLRRAVPFNEVLLLFSDQTQFQLSADGALTPDTVKVDQTTEFEASLKSRPVGAGQNIYFAQKRGDYSGIREYFVEADAVQNDAVDITAHVPRYIQGSVTKLAASSTEDLLVVLSSGAENAVYVYKWYWSGKEKLQSCWGRWVFPDTEEVLSVTLIESSVYLVIQRTDGMYLERIDLQTEDDSVGYQVHLDRLITLTGTYDSGTGRTTWTLPYEEAGDMYVILGPDFTGRTGDEITITRPTSDTISARGDCTAGEVYVGRVYELTYEFSQQYVRDQTEGHLAINEGRLQLLDGRLVFTDSGSFSVRVTVEGRDAFTYKNRGILGTPALTIGQPLIQSGTFPFPILSRSDRVTLEILNDGYQPSTFQSAEWTATFPTLSRRLA